MQVLHKRLIKNYVIYSQQFISFVLMAFLQGAFTGVLPYFYIQIAFALPAYSGNDHEWNSFFDNLFQQKDVLIITLVGVVLTIVTFVLNIYFYDVSFISSWKELMLDAIQDTLYARQVPSHEDLYRIYHLGDSRLRDLFNGLRDLIVNAAATTACLVFMGRISVKFTFIFLSFMICTNVLLAYLHAKTVEVFSKLKQERNAFVVHDLKQKARLMKLVKTANKTQQEMCMDQNTLKNFFHQELILSKKLPIYMNILFGTNTHFLQSVVMALGVLYLQFHGDIVPTDGVILFIYVMNLGRFFQEGCLAFAIFTSSLKACQVLLDDAFAFDEDTVQDKLKQVICLNDKKEKQEMIQVSKELQKLVSLTDLVKSFHGYTILKNISIELKMGSKTAIVGVSGAGKSTLLDLMMGYQFPDTPSLNPIYIQEAAYIPPLNQSELWKTSLNHNLCYSSITEPSLEKVLKVVKMLKLDKFSKSEKNELDYLYKPMDPSTLSSGERQRVLIGRALLSGRSVMISDEGTSALDKQMEESVLNEMKNVFVNGWVLVTHDWNVLRECDQALVLNQGRIEEMGNPMQLVHETHSIVHLLFGKMAGLR